MSKSLLAAALLAASWPVLAAEESDLAAIRTQINEMKQQYEARIAALEQKLASAERRPLDAAPTGAPVAAPPPAAASTANAFNPEVSLILQGRYRAQRTLAERAIGGFVAAGAHAHDTAIDPANQRGFSLDHTELVLAANVDPHWRGQAILAMKDGAAEVEEAWFRSLGLDQGLGLKVGRQRSGIGYLNGQHPHMWDFADAPLMYRALFGDEGSYLQDGVQLKWLAPTELFVELGAELGRGAAFPGSERNVNGAGASALFAHLGGDLGVAHTWRGGLSYLQTRAQDRSAHFEDVINGVEALGNFSGRSSTWLADFVWKWAPNGNPAVRNLKVQGEYFVRAEQGNLACAEATAGVAVSCDGVVSDYSTRQRGWYAQTVYQFAPAWRAGLRYERLDSGRRDLGTNAAFLAVDAYRPQKSSAMVDYRWSEFSRLRLQYAVDQATPGFTDRQWTLQYVMSLGAHGAHTY
ncbi:MAG: TonB-dependent receptor [Dechloromonas sp.]|nr:TonB-dependent receptor [Dechloromonas sp.]